MFPPKPLDTLPLEVDAQKVRCVQIFLKQYNTGEKHTVVMLLVIIGKENTFTLYNEPTETFYHVYKTVVS